MTDIYVHFKDDFILDQDPSLYEYWHLTNHYFYRKPGPNGETYDYSSIDPAVFNKNYLSHERRWWRDGNHPHLYRDVILDLEMNHIWKTEDPEWDRWTQEYINIARMMKAAVKPVAIYGVYLQAMEYQIWLNLGRFTWYTTPKLNPKYRYASKATVQYWHNKLEEYKQKERELLRKLNILSDRFSPEIDAVVPEFYMGYDIPNTNYNRHWKWFAWEFLVRSKLEAYSTAFQDKPIYAFVQPNFTVSWNPAPLSVWNKTVNFLLNEKVKRLYVFNSRNQPKIKGWESVLLNRKTV